MISRQEHLDWCKKRAWEYIKRGDYVNAVASMLSDLRKHPETEPLLQSAGIVAFGTLLAPVSKEDAERFIEGFH